MELHALKVEKHAHRDYHLSQRMAVNDIAEYSKNNPDQSIAIVVDGTLDSRVPHGARLSSVTQRAVRLSVGLLCTADH